MFLRAQRLRQINKEKAKATHTHTQAERGERTASSIRMGHNKMSTNGNNNANRQEIVESRTRWSRGPMDRIARSWLRLAEPDFHCQTLSNRWARSHNYSTHLACESRSHRLADWLAGRSPACPRVCVCVCERAFNTTNRVEWSMGMTI